MKTILQYSQFKETCSMGFSTLCESTKFVKTQLNNVDFEVIKTTYKQSLLVLS